MLWLAGRSSPNNEFEPRNGRTIQAMEFGSFGLSLLGDLPSERLAFELPTYFETTFELASAQEAESLQKLMVVDDDAFFLGGQRASCSRGQLPPPTPNPNSVL